jgi:hypothetical protein
MLSSFLNKTLQMPIDEDLYKKKLMDLVQNSRYQKTTSDVSDVDMTKSFA